MKAVFTGSFPEGTVKVLFKGSYDECIAFMRKSKEDVDLVNLNEDGSFGRLSSWVL